MCQARCRRKVGKQIRVVGSVSGHSSPCYHDNIHVSPSVGIVIRVIRLNVGVEGVRRLTAKKISVLAKTCAC